MDTKTQEYADQNIGTPEVVEPFLKWPGGKRWLAARLVAVFQEELNGTYYEPFVGGGAVFLALQPQCAVLSDVNPALIGCLKTIRRKPEMVLKVLRRWTNTEECYYQVRSLTPHKDTTRAAKLIYLTKTCWGGIYRVNRQGYFNVPFGDSGRMICRAEEFRLAAHAFKRAQLLCGDFEPVIELSKDGDVVYADPPYTTLGQNNGFVRYNERLFAWTDQQRLAEACSRAKDRGVFVAVSGLWHKSIISLYSGWWAMRFDRMSTVSRTLRGRRRISEVVFFSRKPEADVSLVIRI